MNQQEFIEYAKSLGWTKADARRAFSDKTGEADITDSTEVDILRRIAQFAGPELITLRKILAAQKCSSTKANQKNQFFEQQLNEYSQLLKDIVEAANQERKQFIPIIEKLYKVLQESRPGYQVKEVEKILNEYYNEYRQIS